MSHTSKAEMRGDIDFELLVDQHYAALYRFAFSLCTNESDAGDLVQETFHTLLNKVDQIADPTKVKSWLFTTLFRQFLRRRKHNNRFPHHEVSEVEHELPEIPAVLPERMDWQLVTSALAQLDQIFRAPVVLFYLEDYSYPEIAQILEVPLGTVKSRIARGIAHLQRQLNSLELVREKVS